MGQQEIISFLESRKCKKYFNKDQIADGIFYMFGFRVNNSSMTQCLRKLRKTDFIDFKKDKDNSPKSPINTYLYRRQLQ
jgi:hypothetical protein